MPTLGKGTLGIWRFHQCSAVPGHWAGTSPSHCDGTRPWV